MCTGATSQFLPNRHEFKTHYTTYSDFLSARLFFALIIFFLVPKLFFKFFKLFLSFRNFFSGVRKGKLAPIVQFP